MSLSVAKKNNKSCNNILSTKFKQKNEMGLFLEDIEYKLPPIKK